MKWQMRLGLLLITCLLSSVSVLAEEDYIVAQPGDSGGDVRIVLETAYHLGLITELTVDQDEYIDEYIPAIQEMEGIFSLEADGIIYLSELEVLEGLICPGMEGDAIKTILTKLANLGYINNLPDNQTVYDQSYINSVKNAEKKLSLTPDGYLTVQEQKAIKNERLIIPEKIKNLKITSQNGKAILKWSISKNAVEYNIYRNGVLATTVKGTTWTDQDAEMGSYCTYRIIPIRYNATGESTMEKVFIEPEYIKASLKELYERKDVKFVQLPTLKWVSGTVSGSDYHIRASQTIDGKTYYITLIMERYSTWTNGGKGATKSNLKTVTGRGRFAKESGEIVVYLDHLSYSW